MTKRMGPIECRVRHSEDGQWRATARRGSGQEGHTTTATAPGPAAAAQLAIAALLADEQAHPPARNPYGDHPRSLRPNESLPTP